MPDNVIVFTLFMIFTGAALLSTLALFTRQSLMVAYIVLGGCLGPYGLQWVGDSYIVQQTGDIGIIFLLFLLGLHLDPSNLMHVLKKATWVSIISCLMFAAVAYVLGWFGGLTHVECLILSASMMFSSTIVGLKLLPNSVLHHQPLGEMMISVLLMQDLFAILVLLMLRGATLSSFGWSDIGLVLFALPGLFVFAYLVERFILVPLLTHFKKVREYMFLLAIAWCLSVSELAHMVGLSHEVGAFIAGVSIAVSPISLYLAECLQPVRDFFLVLFFFSVGASFNFAYLPSIVWSALLLAVVAVCFKPVVLRMAFGYFGESNAQAWELGWRLGQMSEFSLLVVYIAAASSLISAPVSYMVQAATILSLIISPYIVEFKYATPSSGKHTEDS